MKEEKQGLRNSTFPEHVFACPKCGSRFQFSKLNWKCTGCRHEWTVDEDGIIHLSGPKYFFGVNRKKFAELLLKIRKMTISQFRLSIKHLEKEYEDFSYSYCLDSSR